MPQEPNFDRSGAILLAVPAFRESNRLPQFLEALAPMLEEKIPGSLIQVVDDGSGPDEVAALIKLLETVRVNHPNVASPILLSPNVGKGSAILAAWDSHVDFPVLGFVDADGAVSAEEVCRLGRIVVESEDTTSIFGSRIRLLGREVERSWIRHLSGRIFAHIVGLAIERNVYDSQCGVKFIWRQSYSRIRSFIKGRRFAFDIELIAALRAANIPMVEIPVSWKDVSGSKVSLIRDMTRMLIAVREIRKERKTWTF